MNQSINQSKTVKMDKNFQNCPKPPKTVKKNGQKWPNTVKNSQKRLKMLKNGQKLAKIAKNGQQQAIINHQSIVNQSSINHQ
jgi:hypothetical protein